MSQKRIARCTGTIALVREVIAARSTVPGVGGDNHLVAEPDSGRSQSDRNRDRTVRDAAPVFRAVVFREARGKVPRMGVGKGIAAPIAPFEHGQQALTV